MRKHLNESEEVEFYSYLRSVVNCNIETGIVTWKAREITGRLSKTWNTRYVDKLCGSINKDGYWRVNVTYNSKEFFVFIHRLVWFIAYGELPVEQIDHINQVRTDNRILNLREVTSGENNRNRKITSNNTSGIVGVAYSKQKKKWIARVTVNGKVNYLGYYDDISVAETVVKDFRKLNGFTDLHGGI